MSEPAITHDPDPAPGPFAGRWAFRAILTAVIWFVGFGVIDGLGNGLWWKALVAGAVLSTGTHAEEAWRARKARRHQPTTRA